MVRVVYADTYSQLPDEISATGLSGSSADGDATPVAAIVAIEKPSRLKWYEQALLVLGAVVVARGMYLLITKK